MKEYNYEIKYKKKNTIADVLSRIRVLISYSETFIANFSSEQISCPMKHWKFFISDNVLYSASNNEIKILIKLLKQKLFINFHAVIIDFYINYLICKKAKHSC